ncbi:hypothetical protein [Jatrophihabitans sp.]|uniref:hypothetical protein n=1 Tax=Jatrophihabitans sp. TaxID=1932789 RepID=UPI0030C72FBD|nr:hypothetical protein [Jatrophihabitans sp.]
MRKHVGTPGRPAYDAGAEAIALMLEAQQRTAEEAANRATASLGGVLLRGARFVAVGVGGTLKPTTASGTLMGYALLNTGGATTTVRFRDQDDQGDTLLVLTLAAGESVRDWFGPGGISIQSGLYVDLEDDATVEGSVYLRAGDDT